MSARCNALQPRRGVHDVTNRDEVADLTFADDADVRRADIQTDPTSNCGPPGVP